MTTAEKLTAVAENVEKVYEAGIKIGRTPVEEKDVNFFDHDGTLLYSYTLAEAQALTELPPLPSRPRLICQGWNWSLEKIKEQGKTDVGAIYITDDGKTRVIVEITDLISPMIYLNWKHATVNLDWGDGSAIETNVAEGNHQHEYTSVGEYEITLEVVSGTLTPGYQTTEWMFVGNNLVQERIKLKRVYLGRELSSNFGWLGFINAFYLTEITIPEGIQMVAGTIFSNARSLEYIGLPKSVRTVGGGVAQYCQTLRRLSLPESTETLGSSALANTLGLHSCVIPNGVTSIGNGFVNSSAIRAISFPKLITNIPQQCCDNCEQLSQVEIPNSITAIGSYAFRNCKSLALLEIPANVETIGASAFTNCVALKKIKFLPTTPPTVENANAFGGIPASCVVEVPVGTLAAYQAETNYATIAAQMVEVEE